MNQDIFEAVENLIDTIDKKDCMQDIKKYKKSIMNTPDLISEIQELSQVTDKYKLIEKRKKLYLNKDIANMQHQINVLNLLILNINKRLAVLKPLPVCKKDT